MDTMIPRIGRDRRNDVHSMAIHQDGIGIHKAMIRIHRNGIHRNRRNERQFVSVERMKELLSGLFQDLLLELLLWEKVILQQVKIQGQQTKVLEQGEQTRTTQVMEQVMKQILDCTSWESSVQGVRQEAEHCVASNCSQGVETKVQVGHFGHRGHWKEVGHWKKVGHWKEFGHWEQDLDMGVRGR